MNMDSSTQIEHTAALWLAKRDAGEWSEADQAELDTWISASTAHRIAWLRLTAAWRQSDRLKVLGAGIPSGQVPARGTWVLSPYFASTAKAEEPSSASAVVPSHLSDQKSAGDLPDFCGIRFISRVERDKRHHWRGLVAGVAAVLALALTWGWRTYVPTEQGSFTTEVGDLRTVQTSDGSQLTLSSNSRINIAFSHARRGLELTRGEAIFDVSKDPNRPFIVQAGTYRVVAVGTRFSVRWTNSDALRVVVTEGRVRLEPGDGLAPATLLLPGAVAVTNRGSVRVQQISLEAAKDLLQWRNGFLRFHDTPLAEAAAEFNRYNTRQLVIADPAVDAIRIGGNFRYSDTDAFVNVLEQVFAVRAERRDDRVLLHRQ